MGAPLDYGEPSGVSRRVAEPGGQFGLAFRSGRQAIIVLSRPDEPDPGLTPEPYALALGAAGMIGHRYRRRHRAL